MVRRSHVSKGKRIDVNRMKLAAAFLTRGRHYEEYAVTANLPSQAN